MMINKATHIYFLLVLSLLLGSANTKAQNIEVTFSGIRSSAGQIRLEVFVDEEGFEKEKGIMIKYFKKIKLVKGEMNVKLDLPPGTYGLALLDDENNDDKMNYSFIGLPKEGFGFSNYYLSGLFKPKFEVFKFTVVKGQNQKILMKIRYM
ncbi:MAG: DUF2141 domain-containing protein [Bacteroidia bacterium]|nr:DUF2141 domain-containing protein [Bacteroidia bacterium]